ASCTAARRPRPPPGSALARATPHMVHCPPSGGARSAASTESSLDGVVPASKIALARRTVTTPDDPCPTPPIAPHEVTIVVLNWNRREETLACLESLGKAWFGGAKALVVDNGSPRPPGGGVRARGA